MTAAHDDDPESWGPADYDAACVDHDAYAAALVATRARMDLRPDDVVLDMACGTGNFALAAAPVAARVHARDPDAVWLAFAKQKATAVGVENVSFAPGTLVEPNLPEPVSVVIAGFILHHVLDEEGPEGFVAAVRALTALKPRRIVLPDFYASDARSPDLTPLPHLEEALLDAGYSMVGVEWLDETIAIAVAEPLA